MTYSERVNELRVRATQIEADIDVIESFLESPSANEKTEASLLAPHALRTLTHRRMEVSCDLYAARALQEIERLKTN